MYKRLRQILSSRVLYLHVYVYVSMYYNLNAVENLTFSCLPHLFVLLQLPCVLQVCQLDLCVNSPQQTCQNMKSLSIHLCGHVLLRNFSGDNLFTRIHV